MPVGVAKSKPVSPANITQQTQVASKQAPAESFNFQAINNQPSAVLRPLSAVSGNSSQSSSVSIEAGSYLNAIGEKFLSFREQLFSSSTSISTNTKSTFLIPNSELLFAGPVSANSAPFDFDGDGKSDVGRWRGATGNWSVIKSSDSNTTGHTLGSQSNGDLIAPEDYDGDNKTDYAIFNPSTGNWTIYQSSTSSNVTYTLGSSGDVPVSADYDGDSKADVAVWRPSTGVWYYRSSINGNVISTSFGANGDITAQADYDGDGKADFCVFRPSNGYWYILNSSNQSVQYLQWGLNGDIPVAGDYDGDSKADVAVFRPSTGTWWALKSGDNNNSWITRTWGNYGDQPVPARYDSDNKTDFAVFRPSTGVWYIIKSSDNSYSYKTHGISSDIAVESAFLKKTGFQVPAYEMAKERLDPSNRTSGGEDIYSRNIGWGTGLFGLSGRSGLGSGAGLSYNSLIWTQLNNAIYFDVDNSNPSPGFRFGFPVIEPVYYNNEIGRNAFLLVSPSGSRTEFRQIAATNFYETADSSYTQLSVKVTVNPNDPEEQSMTLTLTNGTKMSYKWRAGAYRCTQIKDSNGNYITINHDDYGVLRTVTDTLGRVVTFNYDEGLYLTSVTQPWEDGNGNAITHTWASFSYTNITINTNFGSMTVYGPANGTSLKVLSQVTMADGSYEKFFYNSYGQVFKIESRAKDTYLLNYTSYDIDTTGAQTDCPRFTKRRDWAENFNANSSGQPQEVITEFSVQLNQSYQIDGVTENNLTIHQIKTDDGTANGIVTKIYSRNSGWEESLPLLVETWATENNIFDKRRWVTTKYEQDKVNNQAVSYLLNPRVTETKIQDSTNTKRATISYYKQPSDENVALYGLVKDAIEYDPVTNTQYRRSHMEYNLNTAYTDKRIIGLVSERTLFNASEQLMSKVTFAYDEGDFSDTTLSQNIQPIQHDYTNYGSTFITGRGNLTSTTRHDVTNQTSPVTSQIKYNTAGSAVAGINPLGNIVKTSYADSFKDGNNTRNTFAYPTKVTLPSINPNQSSEADNSTTAAYVFHYGAVWKTQGIKPLNQTSGANTTNTFDAIGRLLRTTLDNNGSYTRNVYPDAQNYIETYSTITEGQGEAVSKTFVDGHGRPRLSVSDLPNAPVGIYSAVITEYDILGRVKRQTTPTEVNSSFQPAGDDAPNMPGRSSDGWLWTSQEYDWKGRVTKSINTDGTYKLISYTGCGCAGGEITTIQSEEVPRDDLPNTLARRTQKVYSDPFGRTYKTETFNWDGTTVYSTTKTTFDALDRATLVRQYAGNENSTTFQDTTYEYDGHSRLWRQHRPEQFRVENGTQIPTYTTNSYRADDRLQWVMDGRGAKTNFSYNTRTMVTGISYEVPNPNPTNIPASASVSYTFDAVGNRLSMTDGTGSTTYSYDQLSRLTSETKTFNSQSQFPTGNFTISYEYNLSGALKSITEPFGRRFDYVQDKIGRLKEITTSQSGTNMNSPYYLSNVQYRSWGAVKSMVYGSGSTLNQVFDNRLRIAKYTATTTDQGVNYWALYKQYEYNTDGRIRYIKDGPNENGTQLDRGYKYDYLSRITEALTGVEARGGTETNGNYRPYRQTNVYDAFGNVTSREVLHWTRQVNETHSYNNNRESTWTYDAHGRTLESSAQTPASNENMTYIYDAAGQVKSSTRNSFPINTGEFNSITTISQWRDGDGQLVGQLVTNQTGTNAPVTAATYSNIRSTVLGGATLVEVHPTSDSWRTFIYAFGEVLAVNSSVSSPSSITAVSWEHRDPSNSSYVMTEANGSHTSPHELDPTGVSVGYSNPYDQPSPEIDVGSSYAYPFFGSSPYGAGCRIDGIEGNCGLALRFLSSGIGAFGPWESARRVRYNGQDTWAYFRAYGDGYAGYVPQNANYVGKGVIVQSGKSVAGRIRRSDTDISELNQTGDRESDLRYVADDPLPDISQFAGKGGIVILRPTRSPEQQRKFEECLAPYIEKYKNAVNTINAKSEIDFSYQTAGYITSVFGAGIGFGVKSGNTDNIFSNVSQIRLRRTSIKDSDRVALYVTLATATTAYVLVRLSTLEKEAADFEKETENFMVDFNKCVSQFPNDSVRSPTLTEYLGDNLSSPYKPSPLSDNLFSPFSVSNYFTFRP